jgi:hypothetical protein
VRLRQGRRIPYAHAVRAYPMRIPFAHTFCAYPMRCRRHLPRVHDRRFRHILLLEAALYSRRSQLSAQGFSEPCENNNEPMPTSPTQSNDADRVHEAVMTTAWQQLEGAALTLARSGPIKDRLAAAYRNHLALVTAEELPEGLRAEFRACHDALTRERPLRGEDAVRATVRKLSGQDADELACSVVRLFAAMVREGARAEAAGNSDAPSSAGAVGGTRAKMLKSVPQVISLRAAEG